MEQFLDSCVVIHYSNYIGEKSKTIIKKCFNFINNKKGKLILCYASLEEISNFKLNRTKIHKEVIEKLKNPQYNFESGLDFRSISVAKQLYSFFKGKDPIQVSLFLREQRRISNFKIEQFFINSLDERAVPLSDINNELVNKIHDYIKNHADCKILASALQFQKNKELCLFVTADKDFAPNDYDFLEEQFKINYSKENWKFPKLLNLMFTE